MAALALNPLRWYRGLDRTRRQTLWVAITLLALLLGFTYVYRSIEKPYRGKAASYKRSYDKGNRQNLPTRYFSQIYEWYAAWGKEFPAFLWGACITLVLSQLIGIQTDPGNFIILFVPLVYVFAGWQKRWATKGEWGAVFLMAILFFGLWALFIATVQGDQQHPIMFLPLPLVLLSALYNLRKWLA